jgi:alpha-beta hydrolase superfamily lysophospholipase
MMANARTFFRGGFAHHLATQGVELFALDFRGHGESVPPHPESDRGWCFDDYVELDLPAAVAAVCRAARIDSSELCYLGHSLGGLAGLAAFGTGTVPAPRRLSLWATAVWLPGQRGSRLRRTVMRTYLWSSLPFGFAPIRALRLGTDNEPRSYVEQIAGWAMGGRWTSRTGVDYMRSLAEIDAPALAVCGEGDRLCTPRDAAVLVDRLPRGRTLRRVGRAHGDPLDPDHFELLSRPELSQVWTETAAFFTET